MAKPGGIEICADGYAPSQERELTDRSDLAWTNRQESSRRSNAGSAFSKNSKLPCRSIFSAQPGCVSRFCSARSRVLSFPRGVTCPVKGMWYVVLVLRVFDER